MLNNRIYWHRQLGERGNIGGCTLGGVWKNFKSPLSDFRGVVPVCPFLMSIVGVIRPNSLFSNSL